MTRDAFGTYHPVVTMGYFVLTIGCAMVLIHPVCQGISLACAVMYALHLGGKKALRRNVLYMLPLLVITVLVNAAFTHQGVTILTYLPSGNPLTLESILYGLSTAFLLVTVIAWFSCFNAVMTSDKLVYLFGRILPALSLLLSMALRMVPRFGAQLKNIADAQRCIGRDVSSGTFLQRARHGIRILSILITWALENAMDTADSMKARGYGLPGRTAFSVYRFRKRDRCALLFILCSAAVLFAGIVCKQLRFSYYPLLPPLLISVWQPVLYVFYAAMCAFPLFLNRRESIKWRLQSKSKT
ncbi:MAG: energy-coupling factor transporter transmembrane protein EcfT [Oscillospiraceae bacterium]|jgi:energy-coupling factor transport system permease protein|nr:energy-coupling factor transporter transmembrane protein EcfT [Oscillospiraceae bacterium]